MIEDRRYWFPKPYADRVARLRVFIGFVLVGAFAWFSHPSAISLFGGIPICLAGLALRAWAAGHLSKNHSLAVSGPYSFVRNPLYLGTLLVAAGFAIASRSFWLGLVFAVIFGLIYLPVMELEEQHLRKLFLGYEEYAKQVPALLPRWPQKAGQEHFEAGRYWKNREYQALLGFVIGTLWLIWRAWRG